MLCWKPLRKFFSEFAKVTFFSWNFRESWISWLPNIGSAKGKHGVRKSFAKAIFLFVKNGRSRRKEFDQQPKIEASWGGGVASIRFRSRKWMLGGSAAFIKNGYLTILEPPLFLCCSRVCLSRQVFLCKRPSWQELHIPVVWACLQPFCIFWPAMLVQQAISFQAEPFEKYFR